MIYERFSLFPYLKYLIVLIFITFIVYFLAPKFYSVVSIVLIILIYLKIFVRQIICYYKIICDLKKDEKLLLNYTIQIFNLNLLKRGAILKDELRNDLTENNKYYFDELTNMWKIIILYFSTILIVLFLNII